MNLVLTGFMGTGKSTIGRLVAERLDRPFVDIDCVIEQRAGQSIASIFSTQGEPAFRALESVICQELATMDGLVIATGGGALVSPTNRDLMQVNGIIICLTASAETLVSRLAAYKDRPLLKAVNPAHEIERLLAERAAAYAALSIQLDTTDLDPEQVAEEIITIWHAQTSST